MRRSKQSPAILRPAGRHMAWRVDVPRREGARSMNLFPIFLKLVGRRCLVVGAGADVHVVAPRAAEAIRAWARAGRVCWEARGFKPADLASVFLVVAATSSAELHEQIFQEARRRRVLCNVVDDPARCDFY